MEVNTLIMNEEIPKEYICPLTKKIMIDPVTTCEGETYEREFIQKRFDEDNLISPTSNKQLDSVEITPNHALRRLIQSWIMNHPSYIDKTFVPKELAKNLENLMNNDEESNPTIIDYFPYVLIHPSISLLQKACQVIIIKRKNISLIF